MKLFHIFISQVQIFPISYFNDKPGTCVALLKQWTAGSVRFDTENFKIRQDYPYQSSPKTPSRRFLIFQKDIQYSRIQNPLKFPVNCAHLLRKSQFNLAASFTIYLIIYRCPPSSSSLFFFLFEGFFNLFLLVSILFSFNSKRSWRGIFI